MKPILFNTEMVRAILDGRKTVTRRIVKPQPECFGPNIAYTDHEADLFFDANVGRLRCRVCGCSPQYSREGTEVSHYWEPPYKPGDVIYVRETWAELPCGYVYRADDECPEGWDCDDRWRPSIHMPKELARLFLRVKDVRIERLNDMTEEDAMEEGFLYAPAGEDSPLERFSQLWDKTIKPGERDVYGWYGNPYVWVIEFENVSYEEAVTDILY